MKLRGSGEEEDLERIAEGVEIMQYNTHISNYYIYTYIHNIYVQFKVFKCELTIKVTIDITKAESVMKTLQ